MNRSVAILLIGILLFPLAGHYAIFHLRKWQLRAAFKEKLEHGLPREALEAIDIPASWLAQPPAHFRQLDKKEFLLHGQMYDIVYREPRGDGLVRFYCLADTAETRLFAQLDHWVQQQSTHDPFQEGRALLLERLLQGLFLVEGSLPEKVHQGSDAGNWPPYIFNYSSWTAPPAGPPPDRLP